MDLTEKPAACDVSVMEQKKAEAPPGASADGNGVVSSGADDLLVLSECPGRPICGNTGVDIPVDHLHYAFLKVQQFEIQGLLGLLYLPHLRLGDAVRPDGSVRTGPYAV